MKVSLNQTSQINYIKPTLKRDEKKNSAEPQSFTGLASVQASNLAAICNISFNARPDMDFLLGYADRFKCAYSGKPLISKPKAKEIYQKLEKRPNAQSAINLLQHMQKYMHDIESIVFDILCESSHKNKRDFQDILQELAPQSLERLKLKQFDILNSTNRIIETLSEPVAQQVIIARDIALTKMQNGTFGRKEPLERIKAIKAKGKDLQQIIKIYRKWYGLPSSSKDLDAFIVQYSKKSHLQIAKRLISSAVASVEHVKPHSRGGGSDLSNLVLVSAQFNNARSSMPLWEYMMLNPEIDIAGNLQKYMDEVIKEIHNPKSGLAPRGTYPEKIKDVVKKETNSIVTLNTDELHLTRNQMREINKLQKLGEVFRIIEK